MYKHVTDIFHTNPLFVKKITISVSFIWDVLLLYSHHEALSSSSLCMRGQDGLSLNLDGFGGGVRLAGGGDRPAHCPASVPYSMQLATISSNSLVN